MGTGFNAPSTRIARAGDIPVWDAKIGQWIPHKSPPVTLNGLTTSGAVTHAGATVITSIGATGIYTVTFANAFGTAPVVSAWCSVDSGGNITVLSMSTSTTTGFGLYMYIPGVGAPPTGRTVTVNWIAIGT